VLALDTFPLNLDLGDGLGNWALILAGANGLLGLLCILQKLRPPGLAEPGEGHPIAREFGIFNRPNAAAGSLTFSPNDSRTVRRVDRPDTIDRGEDSGGCSDEFLCHSL
jgi:hypothetical protein